MLPWREGGLTDKMWAWPYTKSILHQNRKHHIWGRAKTTACPTFWHHLQLVSPRVHFTCALTAQRNTGILIHSYPIKSERHHLSCPGCEHLPASHSRVSWPTHASAPCGAGAARSSAGAFQQRPAQPNHLLPVSQTIFITRTQHLNDRLYLSKHVIFSQQSWIQVSGVSVSRLMPRLKASALFTYWTGPEKKLF